MSMEKPIRSWDQGASSLLWAHEMRRENIHLVNQLDNTRADLASTIKTTKELKQHINLLEQKVDAGCCDVDKKLKELEYRIETKLESISRRIETLEAENARLKTTVDDIETKYSTEIQERDRLKESIHAQVMDDVRTLRAREMGMLRCDGGRYLGTDTTESKNTCPEPEVLVPDSMPLNEQISVLNRQNSTQALTETTWGSSSELGPSLSEDDYQAETEVAVSQSMNQNGRSLVEYLSHVEEIRGRLPPWEREDRIVRAFIRGLDGPRTRDFIEGQMDVAGWSWDVLTTAVQNVIREEQAQALSSNMIKPKHKKQRRYIPIVPADEEDDLI